jgi:hypothetical protein
MLPATVEALELMVMFTLAMSGPELLPSAATARFSTSPTYRDERLSRISVALGRARASAEIEVSKRISNIDRTEYQLCLAQPFLPMLRRCFTPKGGRFAHEDTLIKVE